MSPHSSHCIDAVLGEAPAREVAGHDGRLHESYERTAARAHLALALARPLPPPADLRARLVRDGLHLLTQRRSKA